MTRMYVPLGTLLTLAAFSTGAFAEEKQEGFLRCHFKGGSDGKSKQGFHCRTKLSRLESDVAGVGRGLRSLHLKCNGWDIYDHYAGVVQMGEDSCYGGVTNSVSTPPTVRVANEERAVNGRLDGTLYWAGHTLRGGCRWVSPDKADSDEDIE